MSTSVSLPVFPFRQSLLLGDFFRVGLEVCPLVLLLHFARFVVVLMGLPFAMADSAPTMFSPVPGKAQRGISNSPGLLSLTGWCFPPLALVMTIRLRVVGHKRDEVCILMIFLSHVLPPGRPFPILGPWTLTPSIANYLILLDLAIILIVAALAIPMAVTVLNVSFVFGNKLQVHTHVLDY